MKCQNNYKRNKLCLLGWATKLFAHRNMEAKRSKDIEKLREWAINFRESRIKENNLCLCETHGVDHWDRVYKNGIKLKDDEVNEKVLAAFAYTHDVWRNDDWQDLDHGPRAARALMLIRHSYLSFLTDDEFDLLRKACRLHTESTGTDNPTLNACFDADRLDIGRVGYVPDPDKMCSELGKQLAIRS